MENVVAGGKKGKAEPKGNAVTQGCTPESMVKKYGRKTLEKYTKVEDGATAEKAAVRCCKETNEKVDGAKMQSWTCTSPKGCPKGKTYGEADDICKKLGMKICTKRQIA